MPRNFTPTKILWIAAILIVAIPLGLSFATYARTAAAAVTFVYPLDYGEGPLLDQTLRLADGEALYDNDLSTPPFTISNYPPVFMLLQAPFAMIFGPAFWYGRGISILSALLVCLLVGLTLYALTGDGLAAAVGGALYLAFPYPQYWTTLNRIDSLALAWSWGGLFVLVRHHGRRWGIPLAAALLTAAIFTRQSYALAAPLGGFAWLLFSRQWRKAIQLALITGGSTLVLFLLLNLLTSGGFYFHIVTANVNPFFWNTVRNYARELWENTWLLLIAVVVFLVANRFWNRTAAWGLALPYLIGAAVSAVTVGKDGSNVNYLLELAAALAFCTGALLAWLGRGRWQQSLALIVLALPLLGMVEWVQDNYVGRVMDRVAEESDVARLFQIVQQTEGLVLAEEYMGLIPLAGKRLQFQPFEYKMLAEGGVWDQQVFLNELADQKFDLILMYQPPSWNALEARWTPAQRDTIALYYNREQEIAFTRIMRPEQE